MSITSDKTTQATQQEMAQAYHLLRKLWKYYRNEYSSKDIKEADEINCGFGIKLKDLREIFN